MLAQKPISQFHQLILIVLSNGVKNIEFNFSKFNFENFSVINRAEQELTFQEIDHQNEWVKLIRNLGVDFSKKFIGDFYIAIIVKIVNKCLHKLALIRRVLLDEPNVIFSVFCICTFSSLLWIRYLLPNKIRQQRLKQIQGICVKWVCKKSNFSEPDYVLCLVKKGLLHIGY